MSPRRHPAQVRRLTLEDVLTEVRRMVQAAQAGKSTGGLDLKINWNEGALTTRELSRRDHSHMTNQENLDTRTA